MGIGTRDIVTINTMIISGVKQCLANRHQRIMNIGYREYYVLLTSVGSLGASAVA